MQTGIPALTEYAANHVNHVIFIYSFQGKKIHYISDAKQDFN
jgi:hypothetical protein